MAPAVRPGKCLAIASQTSVYIFRLTYHLFLNNIAGLIRLWHVVDVKRPPSKHRCPGRELLRKFFLKREKYKPMSWRCHLYVDLDLSK